MTKCPILLVDDEDDLRAFLKEALTEDGYQVEDAPDASTALAVMGKRHFPVVLTDLNMPGGPTGFDLIAAVKAEDPRTLCVVITGFASMETAVQAVKFGAYDFVQKPFKLAEIEAVLDRALDHAQLLGQLQDYQKDLEERIQARVQDLRQVHGEALALADLLVAALEGPREAPRFRPFLDPLLDNLRPSAWAFLLPEGTRWRTLAAQDFEPGPGLPSPQALETSLAGLAGSPWAESHLLPLRAGGRTLGALFLGFAHRRDFSPDDPGFRLWRRLAEAALLGVARREEP